jgi:hypothetical protein
MGHTVFTVNGVTMLDDPLDHWAERPPEQLMALLDPRAENRPWMRSALIALVDAAVGNQPTHIDVITSATSWTLHVKSTL